MENQIVNPMKFTDLQAAAMVEDLNALKNDPDVVLQHDIQDETWRNRQVLLDAQASLAKLDEARRLNDAALRRKFGSGRVRSLCLRDKEPERKSIVPKVAAGVIALSIAAIVVSQIL